MKPPKDIHHPVHDLIGSRWSPRAFDIGKEISSKTLHSLLESVRWAPSGFNNQPWHLIVGDKHKYPESYQMIIDVLVPWNQQWAITAPLLILTVTREKFELTGEPNKHSWYELGLAIGNLTFQVMHEGLYMHQMGGFSEEKAREVFDIPSEFAPVSVIAIGYRGDVDQLPREIKEKEFEQQERKHQKEYVHFGKW
ncbi:nitroreductase family protein [Aureibacter tunicatorum]|uniref:Nitroreductase n=1 Tax=Aureibacter tunicatorum TaxID=866807 RepID=A0AAE3XS04_9BACT|nr:nitroreductase family protein [Aureibacter tunicatorum]MDR6241698.1 nitroreductase [Aureibacter tunicatorum]